MDTSTAKALRKTLTKIKAVTAGLVRDARYDTSSAGLSRNAFQRDRGWRKHKRAVGKLTRMLTKAQVLASLLDSDTRLVISKLADATRAVTASCNEFQREKEWVGQAPLRDQISLIEAARRLTRASQ